jgi:arylsulfatase A-like enzyme
VLIAGETDLPAEHSYTAYVADQTIDALRRLKDGPFSLTSAYLAPHHPWTVPDRFAHSPKPEDMPTPETLNHGRENTPWTNSFWDLPQPYRDNMGVFQARYYQLLQEADYHIGRVLNALEELGLAENTLVIFCADHGEMLGDHGLTQKFVPYDASVRIPMMMRLPGAIGAGTTVEHPVNSLDIFATIFDYLGLPCPEQDGLSLRPLIEGRSSDYPDFGFSEWGGPNGWLMFADSDWKYVWTRQPEAVDCLFDLRNDPMELNNLLGANPRRADYLPQAQRVKDHMLAWMDRIGHPYRRQLAEAEIA